MGLLGIYGNSNDLFMLNCATFLHGQQHNRLATQAHITVYLQKLYAIFSVK